MSAESTPEQRRRARLEDAFAAEDRRAQRAGARVVVAGLAVLAAWITWENGLPAALFYYPFILGFALVSLGPWLFWRDRPAPAWERYARLTAAVVLFTVLGLTQNPFDRDFHTPQMMLRWSNDLYLFIVLASAVFSYSPRVVLWTGFAAAVLWGVGALWILSLPETVYTLPRDFAAMPLAEQRALLMDPNFVLINGLVRLVLTLLVVSVTLAAFVQRSRRMVMRQADAERQRANLSRYFSPNVVDEIAQSDLPLSTTRRQDAAVLFTDIVGFAAMSARESPESVIETLRQVHRRVETAVFAHDGTLEKYIGDGAMATFGTPHSSPKGDASNALRCIGALLASMQQWNAERITRGLQPIRIGIGAHYGAVVLGDIGGPHRLEFAVVGDTVNVASRLERLTRDLGATVVVSGDLIDASASEGSRAADILPDLHPVAEREVRGREGLLRLWTQGTDSTPRAASP